MNPPPSSNDRLPSNAGLKLWLLTAVLALAVLAGLELLWRSQGFVPSVTDEPALWAVERARLETAPPETLLLLGRSRMLQSFVPEVFHEMLPDWKYIQLSVDGKHPLGTLRDVAENTEFSGVVVCLITVPSLLPELWDQQAEYLRFYELQFNPLSHAARQVKSFLESRFTVLLPNLLLHEALPDLLRGKLAPQYRVLRSDRVQEVDYRKVDLEEHVKGRMHDLEANYKMYRALEGFKEWPKGQDEIERWVQIIQDRGGRVVFMFPIVSGEYAALQEELIPKAHFWDDFAARTNALALHFTDIPALAEVECAEGSHLYREDCHLFTRALLEELRRRDVLR